MCRAMANTAATGASEAPWNTTSAAFWLISAALDGDTEASAVARHGPSFSPSPTISTRRPAARSAAMVVGCKLQRRVGQRAGLIEHHGVDPDQPLQRRR